MKQKRLSREQEDYLDSLLGDMGELMEKKIEFYQPVNHKDPKNKCPVCGVNKDSPIFILCDNIDCPFGFS